MDKRHHISSKPSLKEICRVALVYLTERREEGKKRIADANKHFVMVLNWQRGKDFPVDKFYEKLDELFAQSSAYKLSSEFLELPRGVTGVANERFAGVAMRAVKDHDIMYDLDIIRLDVHG